MRYFTYRAFCAQNKLFLVLASIFFMLEFIFMVLDWPFNREEILDELQLYTNVESQFIEVNSNYLRIYPSRKCECNKKSFIKLQPISSNKYNVYMVSFLLKCSSILNGKKRIAKTD